MKGLHKIAIILVLIAVVSTFVLTPQKPSIPEVPEEAKLQITEEEILKALMLDHNLPVRFKLFMNSTPQAHKVNSKE